MKKYLRFLGVMVALLLLQVLPAQSYASFPYGGSEYQVVPGVITWDAANTAAQALGTGWHLAVITSAAEDAAVYGYLVSVVGPNNEYWLGGYQDPITQTNPTLGWTWVTGEPWSYTNWYSSGGEPNDFFGPASEQYLAMRAFVDGWNDSGGPGFPTYGFIAERNNVPEPTTMLLYGVGFAGAGLYRRMRRKMHK